MNVSRVETAFRKLAGAEIHPWTLRFRSQAVECEFDSQWLTHSLKLIRIWSAIGIAVFVAFGALEWWIAPQNVETSFWIRYGLVLPFQLGFFAITYSRYHRRFHAHNLTICTFITNLSYLYLLSITPFPHNMIYYFMIVLITIFTDGFIGVRFVHCLLASSLTFLGYALVIVTVAPITAKATTVLLLVLFLVMLVSGFSNYNQELHVRRDFRLNKLLALQAQETAELARRATEASEAKSRFLAMMSHELRTPLNAIIGFSELIVRQTFGPVQPPRYQEYIADIEASGKHLLSVINDILDLSKAEQGMVVLSKEQLPIVDIIRFCMRSLEHRSKQGGVRLDLVHDPAVPEVWADERILKQILLNLLSNAIKFTPAGGAVEVSTERSSKAVLMRIRDTGIGIAPGDLATAMSPFGQVDSSLSRKYEGSGLGLPLTRTLVDLHGGCLTLESEVGKGTVVTVELPLHPSWGGSAHAADDLEARANLRLVAAEASTA